jgi:hypothetical protein
MTEASDPPHFSVSRAIVTRAPTVSLRVPTLNSLGRTPAKLPIARSWCRSTKTAPAAQFLATPPHTRARRSRAHCLSESQLWIRSAILQQSFQSLVLGVVQPRRLRRHNSSPLPGHLTLRLARVARALTVSRRLVARLCAGRSFRRVVTNAAASRVVADAAASRVIADAAASRVVADAADRTPRVKAERCRLVLPLRYACLSARWDSPKKLASRIFLAKLPCALLEIALLTASISSFHCASDNGFASRSTSAERSSAARSRGFARCRSPSPDPCFAPPPRARSSSRG